MNNRFCGLIIMDGFGISTEHKGNAIYLEGTPYIKELVSRYSHTQIGASGMDVGLPDGQMGNSEVGHLNMGAGRIVYQELTKITKAISDGDFFENKAFLDAMENAKKNGKKLHVMGLLGNGGVHSHITHLKALIEMAKKQGLENVYVHCFMDGRDVPPTSGLGFVKELEAYMKEIGIGEIATLAGRYYPMDRDNRWDRVEKGFDAMTLGEGLKFASAEEAIEDSYKRGVTDEFVVPSVVVRANGEPVAKIEKGDSVIFFNFRPDRAREITRAFTFEDFSSFERKCGYLGVKYVSMTQYDATFDNLEVAFKPQSLKNTLGEYFAANGIKQLRIAETEKYAHVTFFFNGGVEAPYKNESRDLIASPKVATYDMQPEMSAYKVCDKVVEEIKSGKFDVIILNYANCDMVGHTGVFDAAVEAVQAVDTCVGKTVDAILEMGGVAMITADHGNADQMLEDDGVSPFTAHSCNPVPFCVVGYPDCKKLNPGRLADIAPTMLQVLGLEKPAEMDGESLMEL